jgi:hypothetical protein
MDYQSAANTLHKMQLDKNNGKGINCIQTICLYLHRQDFESAKSVCENEFDKIRNHPEIVSCLKSLGLVNKKRH